MLILALLYPLLLCYRITGQNCPSTEPELFATQFGDYLIGYNLMRGPAGVSAWSLFQTPHRAPVNGTDICRTAKLKNRHGTSVDIRLPPYVDQLETYPDPTIFDASLSTYNSTWRAYMDWRRRRCGTTATVTNETKYEELYSVLEYPFRLASAALAYEQEFQRLLKYENRFFRISTAVVSGAMTIRPRSLDQLDRRFVEYITAALDGSEKLEPVNTVTSWQPASSRYWDLDDNKAHNWHVIFSDAYGTHYPTGIKFGHIVDIWLSRSSCRQQSDARLSELAQCYFADSKINLTVGSPGTVSMTSKDGIVSISNRPNKVEICPHLNTALHDIRAYITHPSGQYEPLLLDSKHFLSDYLKRIPEDVHRLWNPTIVEARMAPICELVPLVKPNDLDAKVACEKNLLKYTRSTEPIDERKSSAAKCDRDARRLVTDGGAVCISARLSDDSCPSGGSGHRLISFHFILLYILECAILLWNAYLFV